MTNVFDLLSLDFMQRALMAAVFTGLAAPVVGTYLVQRRLALLGDGIGHVAVTGVAIGLWTGASPTWTAVALATVGAVVIEMIRQRGQTGGDVLLAIMLYGGLAGGVLISGLAGQSTAVLGRYLFGSITTISEADVIATVVLLVGVGLAPQLFAVAQDPEFARVSGLDIRVYNIVVAVMAAVSVTVAMRTVGLLLVSALMVVPVAATTQLTRSFRSTLAASMVVGLLAAVGGLLLAAQLSFTADVAPGPTIVLVALACFVATWPVGAWLRRRARLTEPFEDAVEDHLTTGTHPHRHGEDCGHPAVQHGDHVDYLHDGHRHAPHDRHYDEH